MNNQKKILLIITVAGMLTAFCQSAFTQSRPGYFGVNLAGAEFGASTGIYGKDYVYPDAQELDYYKAKGLRLIRLPLKWERLQPVLGKALDSTELNRVIAVVDAANEKGLYIIPDLHNYGRRGINRVGYIIGTPEVSVNQRKIYGGMA